MSNKPENPPAFLENRFYKVGEVSEGNCVAGMTLRDYFAGQALPVLIKILENGSGEHGLSIDGADGCAAIAYIYADAMLKARK